MGPDKELTGNENLFKIEKKPNISLRDGQESLKSRLETLLKQRVEEIKQAESNAPKTIVAHPGSEFKPENVPYIPDSTNPALDKHTLATPERNAGYQDSAMVPKMYKEHIRPNATIEVVLETIPADNETKQVDSETNQGIDDINPNKLINMTEDQKDKLMDNIVDKLIHSGHSQPTESGHLVQGTKSGTEPEPKQPEFKLKVDRTKMHGGGFYMPNESRPYRPGG